MSVCLSACSLKEDVADLYKKETPLEAEIVIPDSFSDNNQETIKAILTQGGKKVKNADFVHFEIWKQDGTLQYPMEEARISGDGTFSISKDFDKEGLYFVKLHAGNDGSIIMPQKQFIVGKLSKSELEYLQKDVPIQSNINEHHH